MCRRQRSGAGRGARSCARGGRIRRAQAASGAPSPSAGQGRRRTGRAARGPARLERGAGRSAAAGPLGGRMTAKGRRVARGRRRLRGGCCRAGQAEDLSGEGKEGRQLAAGTTSDLTMNGEGRTQRLGQLVNVDGDEPVLDACHRGGDMTAKALRLRSGMGERFRSGAEQRRELFDGGRRTSYSLPTPASHLVTVAFIPAPVDSYTANATTSFWPPTGSSRILLQNGRASAVTLRILPWKPTAILDDGVARTRADRSDPAEGSVCKGVRGISEVTSRARSGLKSAAHRAKSTAPPSAA